MSSPTNTSHTVLLTRHTDAAQKSAASLKKRGHLSEIFSLSDVKPLKTIRPEGDFDLLILTSPLAANMLSRQAQFSDLRAIPVCCVGNFTAHRAQAAGCESIIRIAPTATQLAEYLVVEHEKAKILYPCAKDRSFNFAEFLAPAGHHCQNWEIYANELVTPDPDQLFSTLKKTDTVFLFSRRTAEHFFHVSEQWLTAKSCPRHNYVAISQHVASGVPRKWQHVTYIADEKNEESMIDRLEAIEC